MPDDRSKRGPQDGSRINVHERWELEYWCKTLGVTPEKLREVVKTKRVLLSTGGKLP
jgi:hypothetical protein